MNHTTLSGNLTREPETVPTNGEYSLIKFSIANNDERKKDDQGNWQDVTSFFDLIYWTKNPTLWLQRLQKGIGVVCECRAKQDRWQDDQGNNRSKVVFTVDKFPIIQAIKDATAVPSAQNENKPAMTPPSSNNYGDIPF